MLYSLLKSHIGQVIMRLLRNIQKKKKKYSQIYLLHYSSLEDGFLPPVLGSVKTSSVPKNSATFWRGRMHICSLSHFYESAERQRKF